MRRAFFSTAADRDFYERKLTEEDVSENMLHVHNAGKTYGKYMPYKYNKAPLLDRDSCSYTSEYKQRPLIGLQYATNRQVAEGFKPKRAKAGVNASIGDWKSKYSQDFAGQTTRELMNAKPGMIVPEKGGSLEAVLGGKGKMMVTRSHLQNTHHGNFSDIPFDVNGQAATPAKGNIELQGYHGGNFSRTSYNNEFGGAHQHRKQAVGTAFRMQLSRSASVPA